MSEKLVFLYVGKISESTKYASYTSTDIKQFTKIVPPNTIVGANEFVISTGNYNQYLIGCDSNTLSSNAQGLINDMIEAARVVHSACPCNIWFGTQQVPHPTTTVNMNIYQGYAGAIKNFMTRLKQAYEVAFGTNSFNSHVRGFYMNHEHIHSNMNQGAGESGIAVAMNYNNLTAHPEVAMFDTVSQHVQITMKRSFMWAPYFGVGANYMSTIKDIGYIANRTNIFNVVFLQPQYYFCFDRDSDKTHYSSVLKENIYAIAESMRLNRVVYRKNSSGAFPEVCSKTSSTLVGCQMEVDHSCEHFKSAQMDINELTSVPTTYADRYSTYESYFKTHVNAHPISYYCGKKESATSIEEIGKKVMAFYM